MKAALRWHPDKNKSPTAQERFIEISEAYQQILAQKGTGKSGQHRRDDSGTSGEYTTDDSWRDALSALDAAKKLFSANFGDYMEDGKINWKKIAENAEGIAEKVVENVITGQFVETAKQHVKARYTDKEGAVKWGTVLGDAAVVGLAAFTTFFDTSEQDSSSATDDTTSHAEPTHEEF